MVFKYLSASTICLFICLLIFFGCKKKIDNGDTSQIPKNLSVAALQTHSQYVKVVTSGKHERSDEIPEKYWTSEIKKLNPIKVYMHRTNIVVVQKASESRQEGLYISIMVSSYAPRSGDDGFTFTEIGNNVYKFERSI